MAIKLRGTRPAYLDQKRDVASVKASLERTLASGNVPPPTQPQRQVAPAPAPVAPAASPPAPAAVPRGQQGSHGQQGRHRKAQLGLRATEQGKAGWQAFAAGVGLDVSTCFNFVGGCLGLVMRAVKAVEHTAQRAAKG